MSATTPTVESSSAPTSRYVVFSKGQRWYIVVLIAGAGWFSTLSSFIYYPILSILAEDLHTSIARINFTVTSYLAVSGVAPSIAGDAADMFGRRPVYLVSLSLYFCANIGIALQKSFVALLLLRMLQSAGISGEKAMNVGRRVQFLRTRDLLGCIWRYCRHRDSGRARCVRRSCLLWVSYSPLIQRHDRSKR